MYKNERVHGKSNKERLKLLEEVFKNNIRQVSIVPNEIILVWHSCQILLNG